MVLQAVQVLQQFIRRHVTAKHLTVRKHDVGGSLQVEILAQGAEAGHRIAGDLLKVPQGAS